MRNGDTRIAWREHVTKAVSLDHGGEGTRMVIEAWRQEYRTERGPEYGSGQLKAGWYDDRSCDGERGFGPTLEAALTDLLREEHRTEQRSQRPQSERCRLSELA